MKLYSWYAHSWYFLPDWEWAWLHELEIGFDLRQWFVGAWFIRNHFGLHLGPIHFSYRMGL